VLSSCPVRAKTGSGKLAVSSLMPVAIYEAQRAQICGCSANRLCLTLQHNITQHDITQRTQYSKIQHDTVKCNTIQ
jgi:hypothetical protein